LQVASDLETVRRLIAESVAARPAPAPAAAAVTSKPTNTSHQQNNKKKKGRRSTKEAAAAAAAAAALAAASSDSTAAAAAAQLAAKAASTCTALEQLVAFTQVRVCAADAYRCMAAAGAASAAAATVQDHAATAAAAAALRRRAAGLLTHPALASLSAAVKHELACVELLVRAQQALARAAFYPAGKRMLIPNCTHFIQLQFET
jgi:KICSTOR complex C12orf66 like